MWSYLARERPRPDVVAPPRAPALRRQTAEEKAAEQSRRWDTLCIPELRRELNSIEARGDSWAAASLRIYLAHREATALKIYDRAFP
jgi:hypothetical protein